MMASSSKGLKFICRTCRQTASRSQSQFRTFTSSSSRSNIIPKFEPTSSPELDALLLDWRQRVFTPAALNRTHQALVYKKRRHAILENDPGVTVSMTDGEDVKLEPMNRFDKPNTKKSLNQMVEILGSTTSTDAWSQLPAFLEGLRLAKVNVPVSFLEKLARRANEQGKAGIIKQCAAMVKKTDLTLSWAPVTRELFVGSHNRFIEAQIAGEGIEEEMEFAESLALMLEAKEHCGGQVEEVKSKADMRSDLLVIGVLLEMNAVKALKIHGGKDLEGTVSRLAQMVLSRSEQTPQEQDKLKLENRLPVANGMRQALKVGGLVVGKGRNAQSEFKGALKVLLDKFDAAIAEESAAIREEAQGKTRRVLKMIESLQQVR